MFFVRGNTKIKRFIIETKIDEQKHKRGNDELMTHEKREGLLRPHKPFGGNIGGVVFLTENTIRKRNYYDCRPMITSQSIAKSICQRFRSSDSAISAKCKAFGADRAVLADWSVQRKAVSGRRSKSSRDCHSGNGAHTSRTESLDREKARILQWPGSGETVHSEEPKRAFEWKFFLGHRKGSNSRPSTASFDTVGPLALCLKRNWTWQSPSDITLHLKAFWIMVFPHFFAISLFDAFYKVLKFWNVWIMKYNCSNN